MKRETLFLKLAILLIGVAVIALCIVVFPWIYKGTLDSSLQMVSILYGIMAVLAVSVIPFFIALYQAYKLLTYIDHNEAFSELSVEALSRIKKCATAISIMYLFGMPLFYIVGEVDDAPGVIVIGMLLIFASVVIAVFAAVLQKLLEKAIEIKEDNDLTI